jgi:hypothetical protein
MAKIAKAIMLGAALIAAPYTCAVAPVGALAQTNESTANRIQQRASYSALFIAQWVYNCTTQIAPRFGANGLPQQLALQYAAQECSCVIDKFMNEFNQTEIINMTMEDRSAFGDTFARQCLTNSL